MRTAFIQELLRVAQTNSSVFLLVGDLGYSVVEPFREKFPQRFLNVGVAEQNMMGVAAGLAAEGYHVFAYSIGNFSTFRCAEQIRNDIAYHKLPVTIVAVGGGLTYGNLGYSHHAVQDLALMRSFPEVLLACPGDPIEAQACVKYLADHPQPSYLRLGKSGEQNIHPARLEVAKGRTLAVRTAEKARFALLTTAGALPLAVEVVATSEFAESWDVASLPMWNAECVEDTLPAWLERYERIVVVEDHLLAGGFLSFLYESLRNRPELLKKLTGQCFSVAVCGMVGSQRALSAAAGLSVESLAALLRKVTRGHAGA